jgi:hypothetical protein
VQHFLGRFHVEKDAGLLADKVLRLIGAEERCNFLLDDTPTGYGRGWEAHQTSGLSARADEIRESKRLGVSEHKTKGGWRARVTMANCIKLKKPCHVAFGVVKCKCGQVQPWFTHPVTNSYFKTDEEAARRYNEVVIDYRLDKPPYSKKLNPPPGLVSAVEAHLRSLRPV